MESPEKVTTEPKPRSRRRRWVRWTFWIANILGIIIAIPVLTAVWPLLKVYWSTRSEAVVLNNATFQTNQSLTVSDSSPMPAAETDKSLEELNKNLDQIEHLNKEEIHDIVAQFFDAREEPNQSDPAKFDEASAVFSDIQKLIGEHEGEIYYIYLLELEDQNGNRIRKSAIFDKPDLDYERSMKTMELVKSNPQLKQIYDAFSHVLGGMSAPDKEGGESKSTPE